jgi:prepilin-type processing-associated H-X9-DG protein
MGERSSHHDPLWAATFAAQGVTSPLYSDEIGPEYYTAWADGGYRIGVADWLGAGLPGINWQIPSTSFPWIRVLQLSTRDYKSNHPGGANFAFCDGSVHFLPNSVSTTMVGNITLLAALSSRAGGEVIPEGSY